MTEHAGLVQIARMRPTPGKRQALLGRLHQQAWAAALVLMAFVLVASLAAKALLARSRRKLGR